MARTMLLESRLPTYFWAEAVNTAYYILNRFNLRQGIKKRPFEIYYEKKPNVSYFRTFGCKCFILNTKDNLGKFDTKSDQGIFLGYSNTSKAFKVYNIRTNTLKESIHVKFNESFELKKINEEEGGISINPSKEMNKLNIQEKVKNDSSNH